MTFRKCLNLACQALLLTIGLTAAAADYHVVSQNTIKIDLPVGELQLTESIVQDGPLPINRFKMHRLRRPNFPDRGALLLLPPLGNSFRTYMFNEDGDAAKSFAAYFARLGYEVWGYSPRETAIAAGACGAGLDCTPALHWSLQTVVNDVSFVRSRIKAIMPGKKPVVGGLSLGAISALAAVNQNPNDYAGLLAWDGSLVTDNPAIRAHNQNFCNQHNALVAAGVAVDDQSLPFVKLVTQLAQSAPNDPFMIPVAGFPPGLTNRQAFLLILTTPNPVAPSPRPGFTTAAGNFAAGQLFFSEEARLAGNIAVFNDVTATRTARDLYCSLSGTETSYSANLSNFKAPVMIIKAGAGFGSIMDELPAKLGSTSVRFAQIHNFGHVDHFGSPNHLFLLETPVALWLSGVL